MLEGYMINWMFFKIMGIAGFREILRRLREIDN